MTHRQYSRVLLADNLIVVWMLAGDGLHYTAINAGRDCRLLLSQVLQVGLSQVSRDAPACSDQSDMTRTNVAIKNARTVVIAKNRPPA